MAGLGRHITSFYALFHTQWSQYSPHSKSNPSHNRLLGQFGPTSSPGPNVKSKAVKSNPIQPDDRFVPLPLIPYSILKLKCQVFERPLSRDIQDSGLFIYCPRGPRRVRHSKGGHHGKIYLNRHVCQVSTTLNRPRKNWSTRSSIPGQQRLFRHTYQVYQY